MCSGAFRLEIGSATPAVYPDRPKPCIEFHEDRRDEMDPLLLGRAAFVAHRSELCGCIPAEHRDQAGRIEDRRSAFDLAARGC